MYTLTSADAQALAELAARLVRTPSLSGQEGAVARILADAMKANGFHEVWTDRMGNVVGRYGTGRGPRLLFDGHMDTIDVGDQAAWLRDPFGGTIEDGILYGRGAVDMKAALAAMIFGVKLLADQHVQLGGDLYVAFVVQEEPCEGMAAQFLCEEEGLEPAFVVLGEPTNLNIAVGQRGRIELEVATRGRAGHAAAPQNAVNAINAAARLAFGIELLQPHLLTDPVLGQGTAAVTHIASIAGSRNAIPDRCEMVIDRRLTLGETEVRALNELQQIIRREGIQAEIRTAEFDVPPYTGYVRHVRKYYPPWLTPENSPLVRTAVRAVERALGTTPRLITWSFSTDGAYTMGVAGIPTIGFGPGEERLAHTTSEQIALADVARAAVAYAQLAQELLPK
ncbi:MAG: YgeY family selenium metabolism-linked hydrolase [Anaerolineae bacterium]|nr:YgeY family selenium metabolism-linked hydrolase [Anaerolineae bacterium]